MDDYGPQSYGDAFADVYDDWYGSTDGLDHLVAAVSDAAADRPVLELGVGTGRIALALTAMGCEVAGVDSSPSMLERLADKPGSDAIEAHLGDMADLELEGPGRFGVIVAAFNTFFNLASGADRAACLDRCADLLATDGRLVIETIVPGPEPDRTEDHVEIRSMAADRLVLTVSRRDPASRTIAGHHVELVDGDPVRLRPWRLGYLGPHELDDEAARAGFVLDLRASDWAGRPFTEHSRSHVSWYRLTRVGND